MKVTIIGDIHGRTVWKDIVETESDSDYFLFLGDYFDPYYEQKTPGAMWNNFADIIEFKNSNPDKVKLLVGNHDTHYICNNIQSCSRYSMYMQDIIGGRLKKYVIDKTLQLCWELPVVGLWAIHAGFTNTWLRDNRLQLNEKELNEHFIAEVNLDLPSNPYRFISRSGGDCYGDNVYQSPLWVRPESASRDCPIDICQIVGHTQNNWKTNVHLMKITLCDSLAWNKYYVYQCEHLGSNETFIQKRIEK